MKSVDLTVNSQKSINDNLFKYMFKRNNKRIHKIRGK